MKYSAVCQPKSILLQNKALPVWPPHQRFHQATSYWLNYTYIIWMPMLKKPAKLCIEIYNTPKMSTFVPLTFKGALTDKSSEHLGHPLASSAHLYCAYFCVFDFQICSLWGQDKYKVILNWSTVDSTYKVREWLFLKNVSKVGMQSWEVGATHTVLNKLLNVSAFAYLLWHQGYQMCRWCRQKRKANLCMTRS